MIIKVCGMREPENIRAVASLGIDLMGFIFYPSSSRFVQMISSCAGIIPDYSEERLTEAKRVGNKCEEGGSVQDGNLPKRVGVFVDDMPQNIVTRVYNYALDYVQLHGNETVEMIDNLRRTIDPDIHPNIKIIKALSVSSEESLQACKQYEGHVDMFLFDTRCDSYGGSGEQFDWKVLASYDGHTPFLLSGGIGPEDASRIKAFSHPQFAGIDLNSKFETAPALKDVEKLKTFIQEIRQDAASLHEAENEDKNPLFLELLRGRRKPKADYSQFLMRFLARSEFMRPSRTEFDCGLYRVSGRLYGPVRLIEPLECSDDPHLTELLIAIDTSGSVKGKRVRRFVQRTCEILCGRDVFAPGTKICIVQCDDRIRDVRMIRSRTELDAYLTDLRLSGFGQTDFRPVFELAAEYVRGGEFADLAGIFYFTDGDGTFPKKAPPFETVFVIDSDVPVHANVPPWAVRVDMDEDSFGSEEI